MKPCPPKNNALKLIIQTLEVTNDQILCTSSQWLSSALVHTLSFPPHVLTLLRALWFCLSISSGVFLLPNSAARAILACSHTWKLCCTDIYRTVWEYIKYSKPTVTGHGKSCSVTDPGLNCTETVIIIIIQPGTHNDFFSCLWNTSLLIEIELRS